MTVNFDAALSMHDALLASKPDDATHNSDVCKLCVDWAMSEDGIPAGHDRIEVADKKSPYGAVEYADPGHHKDGIKRYPIDTEAHARAAWSYIHQAKNAEKYSSDQLAMIRSKIAKALKKFGELVEDEGEKAEIEKPNMSADVETDGSLSSKPDDASEGGIQHMETITIEAHEALVEKALREGTASLEGEKAGLGSEVAGLKDDVAAKDAEIESLKAENERINGELDNAQVTLKAAQDETAALRADIASKEAEEAKAEVAAARAAQVKNLSLFTEEYVADKSARWAEYDEAAWTERLDEWKAAKGNAPASAPTTDVASAMTGTSELATGKSSSARRKALGLS